MAEFEERLSEHLLGWVTCDRRYESIGVSSEARKRGELLRIAGDYACAASGLQGASSMLNDRWQLTIASTVRSEDEAVWEFEMQTAHAVLEARERFAELTRKIPRQVNHRLLAKQVLRSLFQHPYFHTERDMVAQELGIRTKGPEHLIPRNKATKLTLGETVERATTMAVFIPTPEDLNALEPGKNWLPPSPDFDFSEAAANSWVGRKIGHTHPLAPAAAIPLQSTLPPTEILELPPMPQLLPAVI